MPRQGRSRRRRGPTASLCGAWRSAKLGHWDRRLNATQSGNFKPLVFGEIHAAGNNHLTYAGQSVSATTTGLWLTGSPLSLVASSTFATFASSTNASTTFSTIATLWLPPLGTPAGSFIAVNAQGQVIATATPAVGGGGTVTNVSGANGIQGSVSSNGSLSLISYLATSSSEVAGNLSYWTTTAGNPAQLGTVATTSLGFSGPFTGFASLGSLVGGSNSTINWTGLSTTSQPASSNLLVSDGTSGLYGVGTSSLGVTGPITFSGTLGAQIGGTAGSFGCTSAASGVTGCLTGTDWDTFNNKQAAGNYITALTGDVTASGPGSASVSFALGNPHWWTAQQNFGNASTSQFTATSSVWLSSLGTPAGTFLAVDPNGLVIATSTPAVGGSGTVTNIATTYPITGGPITTTGTLSLAFGTTTTNTWAHQIFSSLFATNASSTNATTTNLHITGLSNSGLGVDANGKVYAAATSTLANISGTLALTQLANQSPNTVLANATGGSAAPTAIATSSFFGTGIGGQVLAWNSGVPQWVATTTLTNGTGISTTYDAGTNQWSIANAGATFGYPFSTSETFATSTSATSTSIWTHGAFFASSTVASQFPFASSTALSADTICLSTDCRTSWPTGGGGSDPFPVHTSYAGLTTSGTSSTLWLTGSTISLAASSSVLTFASSTAITVSGMSYFNGGFLSLASSTLGNGTQTGGLTISGGATTTGNAYFASNLGIGTISPGYALDVNGDVNVASGKCFRVNGVCIGMIVKLSAIYATSTAGTTTVQFTGAANSNPSYSSGTLTLQNNIAYYVVEGWGGGGGGTNNTNGAGVVGSSTCYSQNATGCSSTALIMAGGGAGGTTASGLGGTASLGAVNINGGDGSVAGNDGSYSGGFSPRGGHGGLAVNYMNGGSPGGGGGSANRNNYGGGGGAYSQNVASTSVTTTSTFVVGAGGQGGSGSTAGGAGATGGIVITIYATSSPTAAGNDYAEMFPVSNPLITAGDIVSVDTGIPVSMKLAAADDGAPLAGVIATNPGQLLGDKDAAGSRPVALAGRVPTKVNMVGGPISIGDRIAPSSVPGVGKKAGPFDNSVGIALNSFSGSADGSSQGSVTVFIDLQRGIDITAVALKLLGADNAIFAPISSSTAASSTPLDFVGGMMSAIASRIDSLTTNELTYSADATSSDASSTPAAATSTPSDTYASGLLHSLFAQIARWLASAANGIGSIFAKVGNFGRVNTDELCIGATCVTPEQFQVMAAASVRSTAGGGGTNDAASAPAPVSDATPSTSSGQTNTPPIIRINGNNPAHIHVGDIYNDIGATITGPASDLNLGIHTFLNGTLVTDIVLDTSTTSTYIIDYVVTDQNGLTSTSTRTVIIGADVTADTGVDVNAVSADASMDTESSPPPVLSAPDATTTAATSTLP